MMIMMMVMIVFVMVVGMIVIVGMIMIITVFRFPRFPKSHRFGGLVTAAGVTHVALPLLFNPR